MSNEQTMREITQILKQATPAWNFDRVCVRDKAELDFIPRVSPPVRPFSAALPLLGVPVFVDEKMEPFTIELRLGDEVVHRITNTRTLEQTRQYVLEELANGPRSSKELRVTVEFLRLMESEGEIKLDPDRFPDAFVPGNPLVARLPEDDRQWPGWKEWNL